MAEMRSLGECGVTTAMVRRAGKAICRERYGRFVWWSNREERDFAVLLASVALRAALGERGEVVERV